MLQNYLLSLLRLCFVYADVVKGKTTFCITSMHLCTKAVAAGCGSQKSKEEKVGTLALLASASAVKSLGIWK